MNTIVIGKSGSGKTTYIKKYIKEQGLIAFGFCSRKEPLKKNDEEFLNLLKNFEGENSDKNFSDAVPVYIYEIADGKEAKVGTLIGFSADRHAYAYAQGLDEFARKTLSQIAKKSQFEKNSEKSKNSFGSQDKGQSIIVLDEIGIMESRSEKFITEIMKILDSDARVIAAVREKTSEFLDRIRNHPKSVKVWLD